MGQLSTKMKRTVNCKIVIYALFIIGALLYTHTQVNAEPLGVPDLSDIEYPDGKEPSALEVELGRKLFFENRLSINNSQSCATCHNPDLGFGDGQNLSLGAMGKRTGRNSPHLYNIGFNNIFFWDGRAATLEEQALGPIQAEGEMNMPLKELTSRLTKVPYYKRIVEQVYGADGFTPDNLAKAIAAFERKAFNVVDTPFDRYMQGDRAAISPAAKRGLTLFEGKAACIKCHDGPNFTDNGFHNIGLDSDDVGRFEIVKAPVLKGAFKTPGLRNVLLTAPYMHNGSLATLQDVIEFYNRGGDRKKNIDPLIKELNLTEHEISDLIAFLGSLTQPLNVERPSPILDSN